MPLPPVTPARMEIARRGGIKNVEATARACRVAGLPFFTACALLEKESFGGLNVYGHDEGGVFGDFLGNKAVNPTNFGLFLIRVISGETSNGVGPCQITYAGPLKDGHRDGGYFRQMLEQGLRPWIPEENMVFGFGLLAASMAGRSLRAGAARYNGGPTPNTAALAYGIDLDTRAQVWKKRFGL